MYFCERAIVLRQRPLRENDKIVSVFAEKSGRLEVNFKSVKKSKAKLVALSESFVFGDYRFYLKANSNFPVCTGGKVITAHHKLRLESEKLFYAFYVCELILNLTPLAQPSIEKFNLLKNALDYIENKEIDRWFLISYSLLLLEYCGVGFKNLNLGFDSELWENLHKSDFSSISEIEEDEKKLNMISGLVFEKIREHSNREINSLKFVKI